MIDKTFIVEEEQRRERERLLHNGESDVPRGPAPPYPGPPSIPPESGPASASAPAPRTEPLHTPPAAPRADRQTAPTTLPVPAVAVVTLHDRRRAANRRACKRFFGAFAIALLLYAAVSFMTAMSIKRDMDNRHRNRNRHGNDEPTFRNPRPPSLPRPTEPAKPTHVYFECTTIKDGQTLPPFAFHRSPQTILLRQAPPLTDNFVTLDDKPTSKNRRVGDVRVEVKGILDEGSPVAKGRVCLRVTEDSQGNAMVSVSPEDANVMFSPHITINVPSHGSGLSEFTVGGQPVALTSLLPRSRAVFSLGTRSHSTVRIASASELHAASNGSLSVDATVTSVVRLFADPGGLDARIAYELPDGVEAQHAAFMVEALSSYGDANVTVVEQPLGSRLRFELSTTGGSAYGRVPQTYEGSFGLVSIEDLSLVGPLNSTDPSGEGRRRFIDQNEIHRNRHGKVWWGDRDDGGEGVEDLGQVKLAAWTGDVRLVIG